MPQEKKAKMISSSRKSCIHGRELAEDERDAAALDGRLDRVRPSGIASRSAAVRMKDVIPPQISAQRIAFGICRLGVLRLLRDVARRLEAVEDVDRREHGDQRRGREPAAVEVEAERVRRLVLDALRREQEAEPWWKPWMRRIRAIPSVPTIST